MMRRALLALVDSVEYKLRLDEKRAKKPSTAKSV